MSVSPGAGWLLRAVRPDLWRVGAAALLGSSANLCAIALAGTAGWLIARAAEHPPVLYLTVAIASVRAFGVGRGVLRYAERLLGHDAAFRAMARTRVQLYVDLERAGPVGSGRLRGGDMLARIVGDVEAVQDLLVRSVLPLLTVTLTGLISAYALGTVSPMAGAVLGIGLLLAAIGGPYATIAVAGRADGRLAPARAELAAPTVELLRGAADLEAYRAQDRWLDRINRSDEKLTQLAQQTAVSRGLGSGIVLAAVGLTVVFELLVGVAAVRSGALPAPWLPVFALVPLAVFEVTGVLPEATGQWLRGMAAADRLQRLE